MTDFNWFVAPTSNWLDNWFNPEAPPSVCARVLRNCMHVIHGLLFCIGARHVINWTRCCHWLIASQTLPACCSDSLYYKRNDGGIPVGCGWCLSATGVKCQRRRFHWLAPDAIGWRWCLLLMMMVAMVLELSVYHAAVLMSVGHSWTQLYCNRYLLATVVSFSKYAECTAMWAVVLLFYAS